MSNTDALIANRVRRGSNATESAALLADLIARHDGHNLEAALVYQGFATQRLAAHFVGGAA